MTLVFEEDKRLCGFVEVSSTKQGEGKGKKRTAKQNGAEAFAGMLA